MQQKANTSQAGVMSCCWLSKSSVALLLESQYVEDICVLTGCHVSATYFCSRAAWLQVLLSQVHRLRALVLLGRFLDMGRWAVDLALSVGIFPYVLKLLQTTALDLRQTLVFIWTKILALDRSCQVLSLHSLTHSLTLPPTCASQLKSQNDACC